MGGAKVNYFSMYIGLDSLCAPFLALNFNNEGTIDFNVCSH